MAFTDSFGDHSIGNQSRVVTVALLTAQLHGHAKTGDTQGISHVLSRGIDVDVKDALDRTTLMLVTQQAIHQEMPFRFSSYYKSTMEFLLEHNADIYITNAAGSSALSMVIEESHSWMSNTLTPRANCMEILDMFFERVRGDFFIDRELTAQRLQRVRFPLALVPFIQSDTATRYFLEHNYGFVQRVGGLTILHVAVLRQDLETVKILIDYGMDLNVVDRCKQNALFAHNVKSRDTDEKLEILRILLYNGVSLHIPREDGVTPLEYLLQKGNRKTRLTLLNTVSLLECKSIRGSALRYLMENHKLIVVEHLKEEIRFLLSRGFDVNARDKKGLTALTFAMEERPIIVEFLMKNGAEASWPEIVGNTRMLKYLASVNFDDQRKFHQIVVSGIFERQLGINVKQLFKELNGGFPRKINNLFYMQIVIASLVIAEAGGAPMPFCALRWIETKKELVEHYHICKERIEQMKEIKVCGSVSLYQLLAESDDDIDRYICDQNFVVEVQNIITQKCCQNLYYFVIVRKRVEKAVKMKELRKQCGQLVCQLTGLGAYGVSEDHYVVYQIVSYLSKRDILNLFKDQPVSHKNTVRPQQAQNILENFVTRSIKKIFL